jgi:hypothetical protein
LPTLLYENATAYLLTCAVLIGANANPIESDGLVSETLSVGVCHPNVNVESGNANENTWSVFADKVSASESENATVSNNMNDGKAISSAETNRAFVGGLHVEKSNANGAEEG